jgi:ubiquinone biosynthesis monooxygenase Coq7
MWLPGDPKISQYLRVNHAGELGAKSILYGQILAAKIRKVDKNFLQLLYDMYKEEVKHFNYFSHLSRHNKFRPSALFMIWILIGFFSGFFSGLSKKKAMLYTYAIESVIMQHYNDQLKLPLDIELKNMIESFYEDEKQHRDYGSKYNKHTIKDSIIIYIIKFITYVAIEVAIKI